MSTQAESNAVGQSELRNDTRKVIKNNDGDIKQHLTQPLKEEVEDNVPNEAATENDEILELMFDPVLNCYFDPKTNKYYELC